MKLTIRDCSDVIDGWWIIERAEHDGSEGVRRTEAGHFECWRSARFSDADVEGYGGEMLDIAEAIEKRDAVSFKRCSVDATADPVRFSSPRNSSIDGECSYEEALELAKEIRVKIGNGAPRA